MPAGAPAHKRWDLLAASAIFTLLGLAGGWAAFHGGRAHQAHEGHDDHEGHEADGNHGTHLSPQALANLGVQVARIAESDYTIRRDVPALVVETPATDQPVYAPIGGRIREILVEPGMQVKAGEALVEIVREPIPRPALHLTEDVLKPAKEEIHLTIAELRKAQEEIKILDMELARIRQFTEKSDGEDLPILPRKTTIDLQYELLRARKNDEVARAELRKHGFNDPQIATLAAGGPIPGLEAQIWKRALANNGLWPEPAERLLAVLPEEMQALPWAVAAVGELTAADQNGAVLQAWLKEQPEAGRRFLEIATLIQLGRSVPDLKLLFEMNAFDPIVRLAAPAIKDAPDFDVHRIETKRGAHVAAGDVLLVLNNSRSLYLKLEPVGGEAADVLKTVRERQPCSATPLVAASGPDLEGLNVAYVTSGENAQGTIAFVEIRNEQLAANPDEGGRIHRSWQLRPGLKYTLHLSVDRLEKVFVLPSEAVAEDGPETVVFVQDGSTFRSVPVELAYRNHEHAVVRINKHTTLFPGDPVVVRGAFPLGLALKAGSGATDPHAGHSH